MPGRFSIWPDQVFGKETWPKCAPIDRDAERVYGEGVLLVDTSVWIEVFSRRPRFHLEDVVALDDVVTCLPVLQEVLQGFRDERAFMLARSGMLALPIVESPLSLSVFEEAVRLYRGARRAGFTIRSGVDCLIGACAVRHGLEVLHHNRDFDLLARISPLQSRSLAV